MEFLNSGSLSVNSSSCGCALDRVCDARVPDLGARLVLKVVCKSALVMDDGLLTKPAGARSNAGGVSLTDLGLAWPKGMSEVNEPRRGPVLGVLVSETPSRFPSVRSRADGSPWLSDSLEVVLGLIGTSTATSIVFSSHG